MGVILLCFLFSSCSSIQAGFYKLLIDKYNGNQILANEVNARAFLRNVLSMPDDYVVTAYERCLTTFHKKRTKLQTHSYYVFSKISTGEYHTISYYGTKVAFRSKGAWALDADSDTYSYYSYLSGKNNWDVVNIKVCNGIDTAKTVTNILGKMDSEVTFYYRNHIKKKPGKDNCNTALWETLVERLQDQDETEN